jgi:multidrug efflux pump subunit AcrA (membrane-fusion protein)
MSLDMADAELTSPVNGVVKEVVAKPGQVVTSGQPLVVLESTDFTDSLSAFFNDYVDHRHQTICFANRK